MTKHCVKCKETKSAEFFQPDQRYRDGFNSWCKSCNKEAGRRYREKNREVINAKQRVAVKAYYWSNREKVLAQVKARHAANPMPHRNRAMADSARRRAAERAAVDLVDRGYIIERDQGICHICKKKVPSSQIHLDHLVPISKGGSHTVENLRVAHARCNMIRGAGKTDTQLLLVG